LLPATLAPPSNKLSREERKLQALVASIERMEERERRAKNKKKPAAKQT